MAIENLDGGICIAVGIVDMSVATVSDPVPIKALGVNSARGVIIDSDTGAVGIELTLDQPLNFYEFLGFVSSDLASGNGGIYLADPDDISIVPNPTTKQSHKVILSDIDAAGHYRFMVMKVELKPVKDVT